MIIYKNEMPLNIEDDSKVDDIFEEDEVVIVDGYAVGRQYVLQDAERCVVVKKGIMPDKIQLKKMLVARNSPQLQSKLESSCVAIFGVGGLGSNVAVMLARLGVGKIVVVDSDIVEPSNLNRQSYFISDLGKNKVDAIKEQIEKINPFVQVVAICEKVTEQNALQIIGGADIVCEAFDDPISKAMLVNKLLLADEAIKIVASSGMAGYYSSNEIKTIKKMNRLYVCGDGNHDAKKGDGLMSTRVMVCAGHQANMILRLLIGIDDE